MIANQAIARVLRAASRLRLVGLSVFVGLGGTVLLGSHPAETPARTVVETPLAILTLNSRSGDLVGLKWREPALEIIGESRLGENFRLLLPKPGCEANYFDSRNQIVSRIETAPDGVTCFYDELRNEQEQVPVKVEYRIRTVGPQVQFSITVGNATDRKLAEVLYGMIGGQQGIGSRAETETIVPGLGGNGLPRAFTEFKRNSYVNLGIRYDAALFTYPGAMTMGWMDVYNAKAGIGYYYCNQDTETRLGGLYFEMRPYTKTVVRGDNWPSLEEAGGEPIGITMGWVNFPYTKRGVFTAGPMALQVHSGDWHEASRIYRVWFDQHFAAARPPTWLRKEMAWQSIILSSPEDVVLHRFNELPKLAADAKKYGVTTFEILGWNVGGLDRGYPDYTPDPRLGTADEFRKALADIRALGVHPLIFTNIQVADTATPLFRDRLAKYAVEGRWAPDWTTVGWGESTIGARLGLTRSNAALVSPAHPEFRELLMKYYLNLVENGADGFQIDKAVLMRQLDFNPLLPVSPDRSLVGGIIATYEELLAKAHKLNPQFAIASEVTVDRVFPYVDITYGRFGSFDIECPALWYTFPEWTSTIFGEGPGDFNALNNGMRYGMVWALAPRHYSDSLDEPLTRPLARYVKELIRIRTKYRELLFLGRFDDTLGAKVQRGANVRYSVFRAKDSGDERRACVLVNLGRQSEAVDITFDGAEGHEAEISIPFEPDRIVTLPARVNVPAERCVIIVEKRLDARR